MPAPIFGFSVGDFISAISLVKKISKALKRTGGANTEYQYAIIELKGLKNVLRHLEALELDKDNESHINAIRGMALACQLPLRDFLVKLEKYEASLGPFASATWYRGIPQKCKWAVSFSEEVGKLRAFVAAKTVSISMLLAMNLSQSLSKMEARLEKKQDIEHSELLTKATEHRAALNNVKGRITNIEDSIKQAAQASNNRLDALSTDIEITKASVISIGSLGQEILSFVSSFPSDLHSLLQQVLQSNGQIYRGLLSLQQSMTRSPTGLLESNIRFEDAMGDLRELPYEYFRHWETFEGFLRVQFRVKLGEKKVTEGQYHIVDLDRGRALVQKEYWTRSITQGARLLMSMIMAGLQRDIGECPRPSCSGVGFVQYGSTKLMTCNACNLSFYATEDKVKESLGHMKLEEASSALLTARYVTKDDVGEFFGHMKLEERKANINLRMREALLLDLVKKEIEVFRNVHITTAPKLATKLEEGNSMPMISNTT